LIRRLAFAALMLGSLGAAREARAEPRQKQVLVLYSTRRDAQIVVVGDREMPRILAGGLPEGLDYYSEFIDSARFQHQDYQDAFRDFVDRNDLMLYGHTAKPADSANKAAKPTKLGKKEAAALAAQNPDRGSVLGDLVARRQGLPN